MDYNQIAQAEFGMDYTQLGSNEQEWVRDEYYSLTNATNLYRTHVNGQIKYFTNLSDMNEEELEYYYDTRG